MFDNANVMLPPELTDKNIIAPRNNLISFMSAVYPRAGGVYYAGGGRLEYSVATMTKVGRVDRVTRSQPYEAGGFHLNILRKDDDKELAP